MNEFIGRHFCNDAFYTNVVTDRQRNLQGRIVTWENKDREKTFKNSTVRRESREIKENVQKKRKCEESEIERQENSNGPYNCIESVKVINWDTTGTCHSKPPPKHGHIYIYNSTHVHNAIGTFFYR